MRMVGTAAGRMSCAKTSELPAKLSGIRVDAQRVAEAVGREIAAEERGRFDPEPPSAPTMQREQDGTGVPMHKQALDGRPGKQPDGSAKTRQV